MAKQEFVEMQKPPIAPVQQAPRQSTPDTGFSPGTVKPFNSPTEKLQPTQEYVEKTDPPMTDMELVLKELASLRMEVAQLREGAPEAKVVLEQDNSTFLPSPVKREDMPVGSVMKRYNVLLKHCKPLRMDVVCTPGLELASRDEAIRRYNTHFGILNTIHNYDVTDVTGPDEKKDNKVMVGGKIHGNEH